MPIIWTSAAYTNYVEENLLKHVLDLATFTAPSVSYVGLGNSTGSFESGTWSELSGSGYERRQAWYTTPETDGTGISSVKNKYALIFGPATADWTNFTYLAFFDAATGGNMLAFLNVGTTVSVKKGESRIFEALDVQLQMKNFGSAGGGTWSKYLQEKLLDHVFGGVSFSRPTNYVGVCTPVPDFDDTGSTVTEPGNGYSRGLIAWNAVTSQPGGWYQSKNNGQVNLGTATADWFGGAYVGSAAVFDASTAGNLLFFGPLSISVSCAASSEERFSASASRASSSAILARKRAISASGFRSAAGSMPQSLAACPAATRPLRHFAS
jgi:hypothetical protein